MKKVLSFVLLVFALGVMSCGGNDDDDDDNNCPGFSVNYSSCRSDSEDDVQNDTPISQNDSITTCNQFTFELEQCNLLDDFITMFGYSSGQAALFREDCYANLDAIDQCLFECWISASNCAQMEDWVFFDFICENQCGA